MSWNTSGPPILEGEDERELKCQFAAFVVANPEMTGEAGYHVFPGKENYGRAFQANAAWIHDPVVRSEIRRLHGSEQAPSLLPSKDVFVKDVLDRAKTADDKDAIGFLKLAADVLQFVPKGPAVAIDNRTINILKVPTRDVTPEDDADFARKFKVQQTRLVADARSARPAAA